MKTINPFNNKDLDRCQIWKILVEDDINAFVNKNWNEWSIHFDSHNFQGVHAKNSSNPDTWKLLYPQLSSFEEEWKKQANDFNSQELVGSAHEQFYDLTTLRDIEILSDRAIARKKFDGTLIFKDGRTVVLRWQTHYYLQKQSTAWKIVGFLGYLPHPMGSNDRSMTPIQEGKVLPEIARNHKMAGPYSPVLEVSGSKWVVISGQASITQEGQVLGSTFEEQAQFTLENCEKQLNDAGCSLGDVFKVNAFVTDLKLWPRFNAIYQKMMPKPYPVRTTVQAGLLPDLMIEIEMWAVKK